MNSLLKYLEDQHSEIRRLVSELEEKSMKREGGKTEDFSRLRRFFCRTRNPRKTAFCPLLLENEEARVHTYAALEVHRLASILLGDLGDE